MYFITDTKIPLSSSDVQDAGISAQARRMHPDDFDAHLAWVTAKRLHESVLKAPFGEKAVYFSLIGRSTG